MMRKSQNNIRLKISNRFGASEDFGGGGGGYDYDDDVDVSKCWESIGVKSFSHR
jgi:hypothetical protein